MQSVNGSDVVVSWNDPTPVVYTDLATFGNPANEVGFNVYRTTGGQPLTKLNPATLLANSTSFTHTGGTASDTYIVEAFNATGSTYSFAGYVAPPTPPSRQPPPVRSSSRPASRLTATVSGLPAGTPVSEVAFYDGATLIGSDTDRTVRLHLDHRHRRPAHRHRPGHQHPGAGLGADHRDRHRRAGRPTSPPQTARPSTSATRYPSSAPAARPSTSPVTAG